MIHLLDTDPLVSALAREEPRFGSWAKDLLRHLPRPLYTCGKVVTVDVTDFKVYRRRGRHAIPLLTPNAS